MSSPILLLGGPPKCGTSSLFGWLRRHPQIAASRIKETFYFIDRDSPFFKPEANVHSHGTEGFQKYFGGSLTDACYLLDGTTHTLYQKSVIDLLADLDPRPHLVFVLRKPSRRMYSSFLFAQHHRATLSPELSFAEFVRQALDGRVEELRSSFSFERSFYVLSRDLEYSRYVEHLGLWRERFGHDRFHLLLFEEMCEDPLAVVSDLADRIGIDPSFFDGHEFPVLNATIRMRSYRLHSLVRRISQAIPKIRVTSAGYRLYLAAQRRGRPPASPEDLQALAELDEYFAPWNQRLASEFGLDLGVWS